MTTVLNDDEIWMQRCLHLASKGQGRVAPNPLVGCVIVHENKIIAEGYHQAYGGNHAEINAIQRVEDHRVLNDATLYVNLEPCSHHGKTPPCADQIIKQGFKRVVIGALDNNKLVNGSGITKLKNAGIEVKTDVLLKECRNTNKRFYTFHEKKRPFYILKWAETRDGFIFSEDHARQISNSKSTQKVHQIRHDEQAILIGKNTLIKDNPSLTTREISGKDPVKIVVVGKWTKSLISLKIFQDNSPVLIFCNNHEGKNNQIEFIRYQEGLFFETLNHTLYSKEINSVLVEGGVHTINEFLKHDNWDEAHIIVGNKQFNKGTKGPEMNLSQKSCTQVGDDQWYYYQNQI